jgi:hypothetical protein
VACLYFSLVKMFKILETHGCSSFFNIYFVDIFLWEKYFENYSKFLKFSNLENIIVK